MGKRVSGLQHEVFALYRAILRAARRKDQGTYQLARAQFRQDVRKLAGLGRLDDCYCVCLCVCAINRRL